MAFPTSLNSQITDSVTQSNVEVLASAPAQAMGSLYQAVAQSLALASQNAVANQQASNELSIAVTSKCVASLLGQSS